MDYLLAIVAGAVQGLTEFIPISSSAHLMILHDLLKFNLPDNLSFDAILHLGTFFALLAFFWREIWNLIKGFFSSLTNWNLKNDINQRLAWLVIVGSIPAGVIGFIFNDFIDRNFHEGKTAIAIVAFMLVAVAILFWLVEKYAKQIKDMNMIGWKESLICGFAQAVALIPGTSRSGITIVAGMGLKLKREEAAKFSFLLSMPVIFGAGAKSLLKVQLNHEINSMVLALGFLSSLVFGYLAVKFFLKFVSSHTLSAFAWYRVILAAVLVSWLILG
ncbi:MAG: undecaprenyl-diphosphatase UppP [Candidatus Buchananbacteria bacterium]|jgi:undecaprenyl-diphosphatase